jgi:hypothetical protein
LVDQSKSHDDLQELLMKKTILMASLIWPVMAVSEECVLEERTVTQYRAEIAERTTVRRDVVPMPGGGRKCIVDFRVRIDNQWHTAFGEYSWDGNRGSHEACGVAVQRAEDAVRERVGRGASVSERVVVCKDRPELRELKASTVGTVGNSGQFRHHPEYASRFWHNGAQCRWFVEPAFTGQDIRNFQGIICEIGRDQWVVVDKF